MSRTLFPHTIPKISDDSALQFRYLRTVASLDARAPLVFPDRSVVRLFPSHEAAKFIDGMRRANVIARMSGEQNFYLNRAAELGDKTVIEVFGLAEPDDMLDRGEQIAVGIEKLCILSTTLFMRKRELLRRLGISTNMSAEVNFAVTSQFQRIRSRSDYSRNQGRIIVDEPFCSRFRKCGFLELFEYLQTQSNLASRVRVSAGWLLESRRETSPTASIVKTAIALESLLIFSESESLARSLSERVAFVLSDSALLRREISGIILRFYDVRSGIVHGSKKKVKNLSLALIECVDRLSLILYLIIALNSDLWPDVEALRYWCDEQKWGSPSSNIKAPLPKSYLRNALMLVNKNREP